MKLKIISIFLLLILANFNAYSQVGINTETPKATMDVVANTVDATKADGIIAPRLTGDQIQAKDAKYGADQTATILYATSAVSVPSGSKTANITESGYYFFNGSIWIKVIQNLTNDWHITGNTGTDPAINFLGTADNQSLVFRANNTRSGLISVTNNNTSFGLAALNPATTADNLTAFGKNALQNNTTGASNTAVGTFALAANTTGFSNVAFGFGALQKNTGSSNTALGTGAMTSNTSGSENTAVAAALGSNTTGAYNTAVGRLALQSVTIGRSNTAMGRIVMQKAKGTNNAAFGSGAGAELVGTTTSGFYTTSDNNTLIGTGAGFIGLGNPNNLTDGSGNIALGYSTGFINPTGSNQLNIGNSIFGTGISGSVTAPAGMIGINTTAPTNTLHVKATENPVKFEGLISSTDTADKIVVATGDGVLKTIASNDLSIAAIKTVVDDYSATTTDEIIIADTSLKQIVITLPSTPTIGKKFTIKNIGNGGDSVVVMGNGANIDGLPNRNLSSIYQSFTLVSDGTNWYILSR